MHLKDWKQINPSFGFPLLTSDDFSHPQNYTLFSKKFANPNLYIASQCSIAHNYTTIMITSGKRQLQISPEYRCDQRHNVRSRQRYPPPYRGERCRQNHPAPSDGWPPLSDKRHMRHRRHTLASAPSLGTMPGAILLQRLRLPRCKFPADGSIQFR